MQALKDGRITEDEDRIIAAATWNLAQFAKLAEEAEEDGVITDEEREQLDFFLAQVKRDPEILAERDGVLTQDEIDLLFLIKRIVGNFKY